MNPAFVKEIAARFDNMMRPGGRIDQILNGTPPYRRIQKITEEEQNRILTNLEMQMQEYKEELNAYAAWMKAWRARQPKGFRAKRGQR